jgi:hypothetical protein
VIRTGDAVRFHSLQPALSAKTNCHDSAFVRLLRRKQPD